MSGADDSDHGAFGGTHTGGAGGGGQPLAVPGPDDVRLDGLLPLGVSPLAPKGPGRPVGAKNRRTDLVAQYLVDRFGDPLTASMATAGMPLRDLVTELRKVASDCGMKLGASVMDVARFQRECRTDALPYIHAKRAPETAKGDPVLPVIGIGRFEQHNTTVIAGGMTLEDAIDAAAQNMKQVQQVSANEPNKSHDGKSHDES